MKADKINRMLDKCYVDWNMQPQGRTPNWDLFNGFEVSTCIDEAEEEYEGTYYNRFDYSEYTLEEYKQAKADKRIVHTLYGHLKTGGVDALADFKSAVACLAVANTVYDPSVREDSDTGLYNYLVTEDSYN